MPGFSFSRQYLHRIITAPSAAGGNNFKIQFKMHEIMPQKPPFSSREEHIVSPVSHAFVLCEAVHCASLGFSSTFLMIIDGLI